MRNNAVRMFGIALFVAGLLCNTDVASGQISSKPLPLSDAQLAQLRSDLASGDRSARALATWSLALARDTVSVPGIASAFNEPWQLWPAASWALGVIKGKQALEVLLRRAADPDYGRYVIPALGELGDTTAFQPLLALLKSSDVHSRGAAATALGRLGNPQAVEALLPLLDDQEVATAVAIEGITWDGEKATIAPSTIMSGVAVRSAALDALVQLNDRSALTPVEAKLATATDEKFKTSLAAAVEKLKLAPVPKSPAKQKPVVKPTTPVKRK